MKGDTISVGNNEDCYKTNSQVLFYPGSEGKYVKMYFGFDRKGFGGMNEYGLFIDKCALPHRDITFPEDKPFYPDNIYNSILGSCATFEEAVNLMKQYDIDTLCRKHVIIVDSSGNSVIIEQAQDSMAIIYKTGDYQLIMISDTNLTGFPPCWRYNTANQMLQDCDVSIESYGYILAIVHQEGNFPAQYSNVYDYKNRVVYVFHYQEYHKVI